MVPFPDLTPDPATPERIRHERRPAHRQFRTIADLRQPQRPKRGTALADPLIEDGVLAILEGQIVAVDTTAEVLAVVDDAASVVTIDAAGKSCCRISSIRTHTCSGQATGRRSSS